MRLQEIHEQEVEATPYRAVRLVTRRGAVEGRYYPSESARHGVVWVGGIGGGWDTPARELYPVLSESLSGEAIASLRIRFRNPRVLDEAVHDVQAGLAYFEARGTGAVALVGHSFGGAVVIQAAARSPLVRTVVTLATQGYGADAAAQLAPRCSLLLLHGTADTVLPARSSQYVYELAGEPKHLVLYPGAGHVLDEAAAEIHPLVRAWIVAAFDEAGDGA